jgi:hypothetical protein
MKKSVHLNDLRYRYLRAKRKGKKKLLDELCHLYGYNRKYLIYRLNTFPDRRAKRPGAKKQYDDKELLEPLKRIWLATDQMCSKRLKAALPLWLPFYDKELLEEVKKQLLKLSPSTIDRLLKPHRAHYKRHGLSGTKPGYLLKNQIPIKTDHWDVTRPGFLEADTVAHCGNSMAGDFAWSITLTDIKTCWTENRAIWNKGASGVVDAIKSMEKMLPFSILGFDCDNGSEFLNWYLVRYFTEGRGQPVQVTRSRPYQKNDNAYVEQKNWSHVRHLFGYDRFGRMQLISLMNDIYEKEWRLYQNHFMPNQKLIKKEKINSKYRKKYEIAKTPYQRILESEHIDEKTKMELVLIHDTLNPFELKKTIEKKLNKTYRYVTRNPKPRTKL